MITVGSIAGTEKNMGRFSVEIRLSNNQDVALADAGVITRDKVRSALIKGVVDTGAAMLVLPASVASDLGLPVTGDLGLPVTGEVKVQYADHRSGRRKRVSNVLLRVLDREAVFTAVVEPKRETALIGAIVMEELDLVADCTAQMLHPRDPKWIVAEIE